MYHSSPRLMRPKFAGFASLMNTQTLMKYSPHFVEDYDPDLPRRKNMVAPNDRDLFIKPLKQCFMKNPRLMPMTRVMLSLLSGWAGQGTALETTTGIIGKHLSRCRRQVFRYLKDAVEEGFIQYTRTKDRIGRYTGIKIWLNFAAIRYSKTKKRKKIAEKLDVTHKSETNSKHLYTLKDDDEMWTKLASLANTMGFIAPKEPPT